MPRNPKLTPAQSAALSAEPGKVTIATNTGLGIIVTPALARQLANNLTDMANVAEALGQTAPAPLDPPTQPGVTIDWDLPRLLVQTQRYGKKGTLLN